jgi:uncharacterized protein YecE (DUF72 family)
MTGRILIGSCSWTDPSLIGCGRFYPPGASSPDARLRYYAEQFPIVEVDSTYYSPPSERNSRLWVARTPPGFVFDVKVHALLTGHPARVEQLPPELRETLPASAADKRRIYREDAGQHAVERLWELHGTALAPLAAAGRLGALLFQFPPWFIRSRHAEAYLRSIPARLPQGWRAAVEFRGGGWLAGEAVADTFRLLEEAGLAYVSVDAPQGFASSTPPLAVATADLAVVRLHGRNRETWEIKGSAASERFKYLYTDAELEEWVPRIHHLAERAGAVHVLFNNNYEDWGMRNARRMAQLMGVGSRRQTELDLEA